MSISKTSSIIEHGERGLEILIYETVAKKFPIINYPLTVHPLISWLKDTAL